MIIVENSRLSRRKMDANTHWNNKQRGNSDYQLLNGMPSLHLRSQIYMYVYAYISYTFYVIQ